MQLAAGGGVLTAALRGEATAAPDGVPLAQTRSRNRQQAPAVTPGLRWIASEQQSEPPASRRHFATISIASFPPPRLPPADRSGHAVDVAGQGARGRCRTISAAPHPRAARPLWSESGRPGRRHRPRRWRAGHRGSERRVGVEVALGQDSECLAIAMAPCLPASLTNAIPDEIGGASLLSGCRGCRPREAGPPQMESGRWASPSARLWRAELRSRRGSAIPAGCGPDGP